MISNRRLDEMRVISLLTRLRFWNPASPLIPILEGVLLAAGGCSNLKSFSVPVQDYRVTITTHEDGGMVTRELP